MAVLETLTPAPDCRRRCVAVHSWKTLCFQPENSGSPCPLPTGPIGCSVPQGILFEGKRAVRPKKAKLMEIEHGMVATELGREGLVTVHKLCMKTKVWHGDCSG